MSGAGLGFEVVAEDGPARAGRLVCAHGEVETPAFMPVGTAGTVKGLTPEQVAATGTEIVLANAYPLMLRPGAERIEALGGLHRFMNWPGPILTDSGGFQIMSLARLCEVGEEGAVFQSHIDGSRHALGPERAVEIQRRLGSDIAMGLDECTAHPASEAEAAVSMRRSMRWAERCKAAFEARPGYGLFGIVQGGIFDSLRAESAARLVEIGFDGYAVGGLAVGEGQDAMLEVIDRLVPRLPGVRPRYLMGVGTPPDIVGAVKRGIDLFDCVLPTRSGRTGRAYTRRGHINLRNARHADDARPLDDTCACEVCAHYARAYLSHLVRSDEILGVVLLTWHNLHHYQALMRGLREAIGRRALAAFVAQFEADWARGDVEAR